jgi:hypothetical protein
LTLSSHSLYTSSPYMDSLPNSQLHDDYLGDSLT